MSFNMNFEWEPEEESNDEIFTDSRFMRWLAAENAAGRLRFRGLKTRKGKAALEVNLSMAAARRFSMGLVGHAPFLGIQPGDLYALSEIPWTHSEARRSFASASLTLCGRAPNGLPIRIAIPANPESFRNFLHKGARHIHLRRVVVAPYGRVTRVSRKPYRALKLVRRGQIRRQRKIDNIAAPIAAGSTAGRTTAAGRFRWFMNRNG